MRLRGLVLLGVAVFLCALLLQAPAAVLYGWFKPKAVTPAVTLYGLQGTIDEGQLSGLFINEAPAFLDLHWKLKPWWLLLAHARFHVDGGDTQAVLDGDVNMGPLGGVALKNLRASMDVKALLSIIGQPYLPMGGQLAIDLEDLQLNGHTLTQANGRVIVHGLAWTLARPEVELGDFQSDITTENGDILAKIVTTSGPLELSGDAKLAADQSYQLHLKYRPKPAAESMVRNLLSSSGAADSQGWYHFDQRGKWQ